MDIDEDNSLKSECFEVYDDMNEIEQTGNLHGFPARWVSKGIGN